MNHRLPSFFVAAALAAMPFSSHADDFAGKDFTLRYSAALDNFEPYADVAAKGGSSAALPFGSSNNPAAISWFFPDVPGQAGKPVHLTANVSGQYSNVSFDNDTQLNFTSETATFSLGDIGVFRLDAGLITSNEEQIHGLPATFEFDLGGVRLNYSRKFDAEHVSIGASAGLAVSDTHFRASGLDLVNSRKDIWNFRLGALWSPAERWTLGVVSTYIHGPTDTTTLTPLPTGGILRRSVGDVSDQFTVQPGIAYNLKHLGFIHADYEFAHLSNDTGSLTENRFMGGLDIPVTEWLYVRGGGFTDADGNAGWTAGLGIYAIRHVLIDLAYQNDAFPEIASEFGRSQTLNACISIQW